MAYMKKYYRDGFCVAPRSEIEIRNVAEQIRKLSGLPDTKYFDVVNFIEHKMPGIFPFFRYEIVESAELPDREAEMNPFEFCIRVRESIYIEAMKGNGHCRFTLAHELGHFFLHRNDFIAFGKKSEDGDIPPCRHSEWQANMFARNLLAPFSMTRNMSSAEIKVVFEVSEEVANIIAGEKKTRHSSITKINSSNMTLPGFEWV